MGTMEAIIRPLTPAERRLLRCCAAHRRNRLRALGKRVFLTGLVVFGTLWLLTLFATQFGANARARPIRWYIPTLLWLVFGSAISLQSYRAGKRKFASSVRAFESALQANSAREVRIRSHEMVEFEEIEDEGACYAFQLEGRRVVFITGQWFYSSPIFPTSDFSIVTVRGQDGTVAEQFLKKRETKLKPIRKIPARIKEGLKIPEHLQVIPGELGELERLLASGVGQA